MNKRITFQKDQVKTNAHKKKTKAKAHVTNKKVLCSARENVCKWTYDTCKTHVNILQVCSLLKNYDHDADTHD